jgi:hypothetical protein
VCSFKRTDPDAAAFFGPNWCFIRHCDCFSRNASQVTYGYALLDTTYSNTGIHFSWQKIKYLDDHSLIACEYAEQKGSYILLVSFMTTVADYTTNGSVYFQHVLNLTWYGVTLAKSTQAYSISREATLANIYDLQGRIHAMESPTEGSLKKTGCQVLLDKQNKIMPFYIK